MGIIVLTLATKIGHTTQKFLDTVSGFGYEVYVLGKDAKFPNKFWGMPWVWRTRLYTEALKRLESVLDEKNDLVLLCDSNDVLILEPPEVLEERFRSILKTDGTNAYSKIPKKLEIVLGTEYCCCNGFPNALEPFRTAHMNRFKKKCKQLEVPTETEFFPNGGAVLGTVPSVKQLLELNSKSHDDQMGYHSLFLKDPSLFTLDFRHDIIHNAASCGSAKRNGYFLTMDETLKKPQHTKTKTHPIIIHFPGSLKRDLTYFQTFCENFLPKDLEPDSDRIHYMLSGEEAEQFQQDLSVSDWGLFTVLILIFALLLIFMIVMVCIFAKKKKTK